MNILSKLSLLFLTFNITSCGTVKIHDTKICTVAGAMSAGANCTRAVSGERTQLNFEELVDMLLPTEAHGPAVIIPLNDFVDLKNELEQACVYLKCKKRERKKLESTMSNINKLLEDPSKITLE